MKIKSKALLLVLCAVLLVTASGLGTMAYLTDDDSATNVFTVGFVTITLDEADVDDDANKADSVTVNGVVRDKANEYHLLPGHTYVKDPTIHVDANSEDCYLFVKVENGIEDIETKTGKTIAKQMDELDWDKVAGVDGVDNLYILAKGGDKYAVSKGAHVVVFENFTIDGSVDNKTLAQYDGKSIVVTAYAVQKDGFEGKTAADIWKTAFGA